MANALASSGEEWVSYLDYLNSGTYKNQSVPRARCTLSLYQTQPAPLGRS